MAEKEIIVKLTAEGAQQTANAFDQVAGGAKDADKEVLALREEIELLKKALLDSKKETEGFGKANDTLKGKLRGIQKELEKLAFAGKANTAEYKKLREEAGALKDAIGDVSEEIKNAGSDTRGLDQTIRVATTAASAFGAVQAATALFGKENEDLQRSLVKVTAAISIVQSLQQVQAELLKKDSIFTQAAAASKTIYATAVGTATGALRSFRLALLATGIGAVVVLIGALIANWDRLKAAISGSTNSLDEFNKAQETTNKAIKERNQLLDLEIARLKNKGASERQLLETQRAAAKQTLDDINANSRLLKSTVDLAKAEAIRQVNRFKFTSQAAREEAVNKRLAEVAAFYNEAIREQNATLRQAEAAFLNADTALKEYDKSQQKTKTVTEKSTKAVKDFNAELQKVFRSFSTGDASSAQGVIADLEKQVQTLAQEINALAVEDPRRVPLVELFVELQRKLKKAKADLDLLIQSFEADTLVGPILDPEFAAETKRQLDETLAVFENFFNEVEAIREADNKKAQQLADAERNRLISNANIIASESLRLFAQGLSARKQLLENQLNQGLISEENYIKEIAKIRRKEAAAQKIQALFNAGLAVFEAFAKALAATGNPIIAGIVKALAIANFAAIAATPLPKFRKGGEVLEGMIRGRSHEAGGVHIEAEGGEYIVNRKVTQKYLPIIEKLNKGDMAGVLRLTVPHVKAALPKSGSNRELRELAAMREELQYISAYIQQGNRYSRETATSAGALVNASKRRHHV